MLHLSPKCIGYRGAADWAAEDDWFPCDFNYSRRAWPNSALRIIEGEGQGNTPRYRILNRPFRSARRQLRSRSSRTTATARSRAPTSSGSLSPFTSACRCILPTVPVVYIPVDLRSNERESERAPTRISFRGGTFGILGESSRTQPRIPANLKDVRHLDGSHAPSLGAVKVDLKGCTTGGVGKRGRDCNHIVSTPRRSFVAAATCHSRYSRGRRSFRHSRGGDPAVVVTPRSSGMLGISIPVASSLYSVRMERGN